MKKYYLIFIVVFASAVYSQQTNEFRFLRYNDVICIDSTNQNFYYKIKQISISEKPKAFLFFGAENRTQYQYFKNENWDEATRDDDGFILNRALFYGDLKIGSSFRLFSQLQSSTSISRLDPNPLEENPLDLHQLFFDVRVRNCSLRMGRQELYYGSQRLISVREGPNSRQSFDALKIIYQKNDLSVDAFYSYYVKNRFGHFNDKIDSNTKLFGLYTSIKRIKYLNNIEAYFLNFKKSESTYNTFSGQENRNTVGSRIWGNYSNWNYDIEGAYQFGNFDTKSIKAWTFSINNSFTYLLNKRIQKIGFKTEYISGDKIQNDGAIQTFNPLFPRGAYFGLAALIGPSNLIDMHPFLEFQLTQKLNFYVDYDMFWRASKNDAIYQPNGTVLFESSNATSKKIGNQLGASFEYTFNKYLNFTLEGTWFNSGSFIKDVSNGKDILFTASTLTLIL
ncbi:alginate export protein [Flavobacterium sp. 90]|uniref:alginate export family protein n=1 Tax=unclassified Flavobacterium TaxID=196869 RepID=UPI000EAC05E3|nr:MULTISPECIES: alginate export family protein [unclassified Flavobacterium]RKR05060.1 alginate export protein [Flavobacterium sp. 81]TCK56376.1 alginate export protein [Flavobacterium sp. 90]